MSHSLCAVNFKCVYYHSGDPFTVYFIFPVLVIYADQILPFPNYLIYLVFGSSVCNCLKIRIRIKIRMTLAKRSKEVSGGIADIFKTE